jgi:hypothetical protein
VLDVLAHYRVPAEEEAQRMVDARFGRVHDALDDRQLLLRKSSGLCFECARFRLPRCRN